MAAGKKLQRGRRLPPWEEKGGVEEMGIEGVAMARVSSYPVAGQTWWQWEGWDYVGRGYIHASSYSTAAPAKGAAEKWMRGLAAR